MRLAGTFTLSKHSVGIWKHVKSFVPRRVQTAGILAAMIWCVTPLATATAENTTFPTGPVNLVVPYAPGGAADIVGRILSKDLSQLWKQPVIVDNRPGAAGLIGSGYVARAPADGHTVLLGATSTHVLGPMVSTANYDPVRDFQPITPLSPSAWVLVVSNALGVKSLQEFLELAKSRPGELNYASYGIGSASHLAMEHLMSMANIKMEHVPFGGSAPAMAAMMGGQVDVMLDSLSSAVPLGTAGKVQLLATSGPERLEMTPELPTIAEAGIPGYAMEGWWGFFVAAKTPPAIVEKLNGDLIKVMHQPAIRDQLKDLGLTMWSTTPDEFVEILRNDHEVWGRIVKRVQLDH